MVTSHVGLFDSMVRCFINVLLVLVCVVVFPSCGLNDGLLSATHVFGHKLLKDDLDGRYVVQKVSWFVPDRKSLTKASLVLSKDGSYRLLGVNVVMSSPLLPSSSGTWQLLPNRGMDLGSRETWIVRFTGSDGKSTNGWCLDDAAPYRLMFVDSSRFEIGEYLFLKRVEGGER